MPKDIALKSERNWIVWLSGGNEFPRYIDANKGSGVMVSNRTVMSHDTRQVWSHVFCFFSVFFESSIRSYGTEL